MNARSALIEILGLGRSRAVARAQVAALRHRVPFLYGILSINVVALAWTHYEANPLWQGVLVPAAFILITVLRLAAWLRLRPDRLTDRQISIVRWSTVVLGAVLGCLILIWSLTLERSATLPAAVGAMTDTGHAVFFVGITLISCIFLLMHHRLASIAVGVSVGIPLAVFLFAGQRLIETAIGLNVLLVAAGMIYVAISFSRHFDQSVVHSADLLRLSAQNARLAAADVLTSLSNRREFFRALEAAGVGTQPFAVIVCDLDGFKQVNDVYGHNVGDDVLREIAGRLLAQAPPDSCVARMGGDEFACLLVGEQSRLAHQVATRLIEACREPVASSAFIAQVGASAGICFSSTAGQAAPVLTYERADYALLEAKRAGRGRVETFSGTLDQLLRRESRIAHLLRGANLRREMTPVFQPIVDAGTFDIRGFETLVRWTSPELGPVAPGEFIPIAERTNLIFDISRLILRSALIQAAIWPEHIRLKVNLSVRDLLSSQQIGALLDELGRSAVDPRRVTFEITETIFAESIERIRSSVDTLRAAGCKIAIDDFGVGYSSLNYIHVLAPDVIKIDRCFVSQVATNETTRRVVRTIVELTRNVGARSVAEGVETAAEARILAELGCNELQGYHFSKPIGAQASLEMARRGTVAQHAAGADPVTVG